MRPPWTLYATPRWYMWSAASQSARWKNPECTTRAANALSTTSTSPPRWSTSSVLAPRSSSAPPPPASAAVSGTALVASSVTAAQPGSRDDERAVPSDHARDRGEAGDLAQIDRLEGRDLEAVGRTARERDPRAAGVERHDGVTGAHLDDGAGIRARPRLDLEEPDVGRP